MNIVKLIESIKGRPLFFLVSHSIFEFDAFIRGYGYYQFVHLGERTHEDRIFEKFKDEWIVSKLGVGGKPSYLQCLMLISNNSSEALDNFFKLWDEYLIQSADIDGGEE